MINQVLYTEIKFLKALECFDEIIRRLVQENAKSLISNVTIPNINVSQNANNSQFFLMVRN